MSKANDKERMVIMNAAFDLQNHMVQNYIDSRIKAGRDDLLYIMQLEHRNFENELKTIDKKIDKLEQDLGRRIDKLEQDLGRRIDKVDTRIDKVELNLGGRIDKVDIRIDMVHLELISMKKWVIGMSITVLAAIAALAVPVIVSLF